MKGSGWKRALSIGVASVAITLALAPRAEAQAPPPQPGAAPKSDAAAPPADLQAQAAERKKAADQSMEALRYADALAGYGEAYTITKDPALLYNMGRALQALNRFPEALEKLEAFEAAASPELKARVPRLQKLIAEIRARVSALTVHTNVEGARILVRNTVVGKSPLSAPLKLESGKAEIEIEAEGYFPGKKTVELPGGSELRVDIDLFSRNTTGILSVQASAKGAEVLVDGKRIGIAPLELNVAKGTHTVVVRHPSYRVYETSAVVPAGGSKTVVATLQDTSIAKKWWFWTAAGALVTAGVVVTVAAVVERPPDSGTIAPGQLPTASVHGGAALFRF